MLLGIEVEQEYDTAVYEKLPHLYIDGSNK
jgi:hypothetical protein